MPAFLLTERARKKQTPFSFNIRVFIPLVKEFIKQLERSNEYHLASHMGKYQPLNQQQQKRVFSMFIENHKAQLEVTKSGKSREEVFRGFIRRYNLKLQSKKTIFSDAHTPTPTHHENITLAIDTLDIS